MLYNNKKQQQNWQAEHEIKIDRQPPCDLKAEKAVLGSMLIDSEAVGIAIEILVREDFYNGNHKEIFDAMKHIFEREDGNNTVDILTVADELKKRGDLEVIGGNVFLTKLSESIASGKNIESHARIVLEKSIYRKLIETSVFINSSSYEQSADPMSIITQADDRMFGAVDRGKIGGYQEILPILKESFERIEAAHRSSSKIAGIPTGFHALDELTGGLNDTDLIILAARPSMGKTSLAMNIARSAAIDYNYAVGICSLEMEKISLVSRMLCSESEINLHLLRTGKLDTTGWEKLSAAASMLYQAPIYIDDQGGQSIAQVRTRARRLKAEYAIKLLIIDYLQLIHVESEKPLFNKVAETTIISSALKNLAKELNIPVIALSQLSRAPELRADKRPILSDLRESGAIEQDADIVMFLYRDDFYNQTSDNIAEINIAKHRNGPIGRVELEFLKHCTKFKNLPGSPNYFQASGQAQQDDDVTF